MVSALSGLRRFSDDRRASVGIVFGLASMVAVAAVGGTIDFGRALKQKASMQSSLDNGILAGLMKYKVTQSWTDAEVAAVAAFQGNFGSGVVDDGSGTATAAQGQALIQFSNNGSELFGVASVEMNTPFMKFVIGKNLTLSTWSGGMLAASTSTGTSGTKLEVSMMIDLTGSMGWSDASGSGYAKKIDALRAAGQDLIDILLPANGANNGLVRVAIAPFADYVNVGSAFASTVTGLPATGGSYAGITNLASTRNGAFLGTYSGITSNNNGYQAGATGASQADSTTFANGYCANPTATNVTSFVTYDGHNSGVYIDASDNANSDVTGLVRITSSAPDSAKFKAIHQADGAGSQSVSYYNGTYRGYFVPWPASATGLTRRQLTYYGQTADMGARVPNDGSFDTAALQSMGFVRASTSPAGGYWRVKYVNSSGALTIQWTTSGFYLPLYQDLSTTSTVTGCESEEVAHPASHLISCVTERTNSTNRYTDALPSSGNGFIGAYNHGNTAKSNYSSDGKCNVAGREMPAIIPLTSDKTVLSSFFATATTGGGTPGHLGTAWAWYMLSPNWNTVFTGSAEPAAYSDAGTKKIAVLMSDGEYNMQYSGVAAMTQALELCNGIKAKGIQVYTVGFGMGQNVTANQTGTAAQRAKYVLEQCSSGASYHYFPADGAALRTAFQAIGNSVSAQTVSVTTYSGARITR